MLGHDAISDYRGFSKDEIVTWNVPPTRGFQLHHWHTATDIHEIIDAPNQQLALQEMLDITAQEESSHQDQQEEEPSRPRLSVFRFSPTDEQAK